MNDIIALFVLAVIVTFVVLIVVGAWRLGGRDVRLQDDVHELAKAARQERKR